MVVVIHQSCVPALTTCRKLFKLMLKTEIRGDKKEAEVVVEKVEDITERINLCLLKYLTVVGGGRIQRVSSVCRRQRFSEREN